MANVCVSGLSIRFGEQEVIAGLDLDIAEGEFVVLLGPSGCGKSTLLHAIAGLLDVHAGRIEIGGRDMTWADPVDRHIGMVFQSYALYPTMDVAANMSFGLRIAGLPRDEIRQRLARAADMLQLTPLLKRKPSQLSGGQRQRVAIGRALVREAGVYLFDEPLSNLDAKLRSDLRRELKLLHQRLGATMIYVTHDQVEAMTLASRIVVMKGGVIQQIGTPADVYQRPANRFVAGFLGSPGMNFIAGRIVAAASGLCFNAAPCTLALDAAAHSGVLPDGADLTLGIRPEDIRIGSAEPFSASVALVEPMGNHQVVWLGEGDASLAVLIHDGRRFAPGDVVRWGFDAAAASLFDDATGQRL